MAYKTSQTLCATNHTMTLEGYSLYDKCTGLLFSFGHTFSTLFWTGDPTFSSVSETSIVLGVVLQNVSKIDW